MSGFNHIFLSFCIIGFILSSSSAWNVNLPNNIKGLQGSCLVIPCSFDYYQYPPKRPDRVVWYQYVNHGYPLVYDNWYRDSVIDQFRGKTSLFNPMRKSCSLMINPVTWYHHRQKIFPWIDPENVRRSTYRFFDTTVTIDVVDTAEKPEIMISGDRTVGQNVQVECSVSHTCPTYPPVLKLNIPVKHPQIHTTMFMYRYKTSLTTMLHIDKDHQTVQCDVIHTGGLRATNSMTLNAACSISPLTISQSSQEFLEGYASTVKCTATYTCPADTPALQWNYGNMPASTAIEKVSDTQWKTVSTLRFTASGNDHGKSLTCYAQFIGGGRQEKSIILSVKRNMLSRDWSFTTPSSITGMRGSCIIIPCRFTYKNSQPPNLRVIWYLYQSHGYPPVYDQEQSVIPEFSGKTNLIGSVSGGNCSLKIERLEMSHNQDRLYPWIDKDPITSFHTMDQSFYDKTTQLFVSDQAQAPHLSISGTPRVGEQSTVSCSVQHTCHSVPPTLTLNNNQGVTLTTDILVTDGIWETTVQQTWTVQETDNRATCSVRYPGGQSATGELKLNAECPYKEIKMVEKPGKATEGVATSVICSVSYTCKKNEPIITWNVKDMHSSSYTKALSRITYETVSNLTFIGSLEDDGKPLNCTARFLTGETSISTVLHIKQYVKPIEERDPYENDTFLVADVPFRFTALTRSCVVIPCSFQHEADKILKRGIWSKKTGGVVYHNAQSVVLDHFKGRTKLVGNLDEGDCSLEIDDIKPFDNGPFCFHAEGEYQTYRFNNSCVFIIMKASPGTPVMTQVPTDIDAGSDLDVSCSVTHSCSSHPPEFSWSVPYISSKVTHSLKSRGIWETTSSITFTVAGGDGVKNLTCTAIFSSEKQQATTAKLNVKGSMMYQLRSSLPVSIPVSTLFLIVIILTVVFGVVVWRKRKHNDDSLTPPPRPDKRRSLWDRVSRRYHEDRERPPRPEKKRKSIWSRFSRREVDERVGWNSEGRSRNSFWSRFSRRQCNTADLSVDYVNNTTTVNFGTQFSKPHFPSPKDKRKSPYSGRP